MRVVRKDVQFHTDQVTKFILFGDIHFGNTHCDVELLKRMVKDYKDDKRTYFLMMGDELDSIVSSDKRFDSMCLAKKYRGKRNFIDMMVSDLAEILMPLRGRIIAGCDSNHNSHYRKVSDSDPHYRLSEWLQFERIGYGGWVPVVFDNINKDTGKISGSKRTITFHITHGKSAGTAAAGTSISAIEKDAGYFVSDIMAHGHTHQLSAGSKRIYFDLNSRLSDYVKRTQHLIQTGSFLKSYSQGEEGEYSPYSEVRRYRPTSLGWAVVEVRFGYERGKTANLTVPRIKTYVEEH